MAQNLNIIERMARLGEAGILTFDDDETKLGSLTRDAVLAARGAREILDAFEKRAGELRGSGHFSPQGLAARLAEVAVEALERIQRIRGLALKTAEAKLAKLREDLLVTSAAGDDVVQEMRRQEARTWLRGIGDPLQVEVALRQAVEIGDAVVVEAALGAPPSMRLLTPKALAEVTALWSEKRDPLHAAELQRLTRAVETARRLADDSEREIRKGAGLPPIDPIAEMAAGKAKAPTAA
jgi:hypothetical protein